MGPSGRAAERLLPRLIAAPEGNPRRWVLDGAADTKSGRIDDHQGLGERGIRAAFARRSRSTPAAVTVARSHARPSWTIVDDRGRSWTMRRPIDRSTDTHRCPTGAILTRQGRTTATAAHPLIRDRPRPTATGCLRRRPAEGPMLRDRHGPLRLAAG
jgi:hypothetical protein